MSASLPDDSDLSELLQTWKFESDSDSNLTARVWRRIEAGESHGNNIRSRLDHLAAILTRPLVAATALAACAMLGFVAAEARYEMRRDDALDRVAAEYVRSIDPVIMTRSPAAAPRP